MPSDPTAALTDAILTATPVWDGRAFTGTTQDKQLPHRQWPTWHLVGSDAARAVAARQAAAALRWLAANAPIQPSVGPRWTASRLRDLADQLDTQETTDA